MQDKFTDIKRAGEPLQGSDAVDHALTSSHRQQKKGQDEHGKPPSPETSTIHHDRSQVHEGSNPTITGHSASRDAIPPKKNSAAISMASSAATSVATSPMNEAPMTRESAKSDSPQTERVPKPTPSPHLLGEGTQKDDHRVTEDAASQSGFQSSQEDSAHNQPPPSVNREKESEVSVPRDGFWPKQPKKRRLGVTQGGYDRERHAAALWESMPAQTYRNQIAPYQPEAFHTASTSQGGVSASLSSLPVPASLLSQDARYRAERGGGHVPASLDSRYATESLGIGDYQDTVARASLFGTHHGSHATIPHTSYASTTRAYSQARHDQEQRKQRSVPAARAPIPHESDATLHLQKEHEVPAARSATAAYEPQLSGYHGLINNTLSESISDMMSASLLSAIQKQQARHAALSARNTKLLIGEAVQRQRHQNIVLPQSGVLGSRNCYNSDIPPSLPRSTLFEPRHALSNLDLIGTELSSIPTYDAQIQDVLRQQDTLRRAKLSHLMRLSDRQALERESFRSSLLQYPTSSTVDVSRTAHDPGRLLSIVGLPEAALHFDDQTDSSSRRKRELSGYEVAGPLSSRNGDFQPEEPIVIPPCQEGPLPHHLRRNIVPLSAIQDKSWLSEFLCFVRSDLFEIFRASGEDVASRNNSRQITYQQIGIRCRFCAHLPHEDRASRSAAFPSSLDRIYQSIIMIVREHFVKCDQIPEAKMAQFVQLKEGQCKGITGSGKYWADSARRKGLVDTPEGIMFDESLIQSSNGSFNQQLGRFV